MNTIKKILFVGVFNTTHSNNIPQVEAFKAKGVKVDLFDYRQEAQNNRRRDNKLFWVFKHPVFPNKVRRIYFLERGRKAMMKKLLTKVKKNAYDLIFISKGEEIDYKLLSKLNKKTPCYYYLMDPMKTARFVQAEEYAKRSSYASATFSDVTELFSKTGVQAQQIVQGISKSIVPKKQKKKHEVIFAGTVDSYRKKFLDYLEEQGIQVTCYGAGTKNGAIYREELLKEYARSNIILNLTRMGTGFSVRVFEAMASKSLLLTEYCTDLEIFFKQGEELDWFTTKEEAVKKIKYYLKHKDKREQAAKQAQKRALEDFTWDKQIERILTFVKNNKVNT